MNRLKRDEGIKELNPQLSEAKRVFKNVLQG
jgi:hypothetical protein